MHYGCHPQHRIRSSLVREIWLDQSCLFLLVFSNKQFSVSYRPARVLSVFRSDQLHYTTSNLTLNLGLELVQLAFMVSEDEFGAQACVLCIFGRLVFEA